MILYLHNRNGSWVVAPYLDKHGEVDPCLRYVSSPEIGQSSKQVLTGTGHQTQSPTIPQSTSLRCPSKERVATTWYSVDHIEEIGGGH